MANDPAFLFYSKDWLTGTAELLPQEKGVYIDLLAYQHQNGTLPTEPERLSRMVGMSLPEFELIWNQLKDKFCVKDNRLVNRKLNQVMDERAYKGHRNLIIGTFASVMRLSKIDKIIYNEVKTGFSVDDWMNTPKEQLTERLTEWLHERLKSIGNGNGNIINTTNTFSYEKTKEILFSENEKSWHETVMMITPAKSSGTLLRLLSEFLLIQKGSDFFPHEISDTKRYFINWVRSQKIEPETHKSTQKMPTI